MTDYEILSCVQDAYDTITSPYMPNTDTQAGELRRLCYLMSRADNSNIRDVILYYIGGLISTKSDIYNLLKMGYSENSISVRDFKLSRSGYSIRYNKIGVICYATRYNIFVSKPELNKSWNVIVIMSQDKFLFVTSRGNLLIMKRESFKDALQLYKRIYQNGNN